MRKLLLRLIINAAALYVAAELVNGISFDGDWLAIALVALIFGLVNALIRPLLKLLSLPLMLLTLGLFTLIINALMLWLVSALAGMVGIGFTVADFGAAFLGGLVISVVSFVLNLLLVDDDKKKKRDRR